MNRILKNIILYIYTTTYEVKAYGIYSISDYNIFYKNTNFDEFEIDSIDYVLNIDYKLKQEIIGFGATFTQSAAYLYKKLSQEVKDEFLNAYFSREGSNYSMIRLPIGTCDCSPYPYNFNEVVDDFNMEYFDTNLTEDEKIGLIDMVKDTKSKIEENDNEMFLFGTVWSPPSWLKINNSFLGTWKHHCLKQEYKYLYAFALYIVKYVQSFSEKVNHDFWGISHQNEPFLYTDHQTERCNYNFDEYFNFIGQYLGPLFKNSFAKPPKIIAIDDNKDMFNVVLDYYKLNPYLDTWDYIYAYGSHIYRGACAEILEEFAKIINKPILGTESGWFRLNGKLGLYNKDGKAVTNYIYDWRYFEDITANFKYGGIAYMDWSILLDDQVNGMGGPNNQIQINALATTQVRKDFTLEYNSIYYLLKMFSANVHKGDRYIDFSYIKKAYANDLYGSAFKKKDGRYVVILANRNEFNVKIKINFLSDHSYVNLYAKSYNVIYLSTSEID